MIACACITLMSLSACGQIFPETTVTDTPIPIVVKVSPTPGISGLMPSGDIVPPDSYTHGEIEMHIVDIMTVGNDCVSTGV